VEALAETSRQRLRCRLARAEALLHAERPQQALLQTAPAVQEARHHPDLQADAGALHALALAQSRHGEESLVVAREALEQANAWQARTAGEASRGAGGCSAQQLRATNALAYALFGCGRIAEAVPVQRDAVVLAERLGDRAEAAATEGSLAALLAAVGDVPATYHHATQADVRQRQAGLGGSSTAGIVNHFVRGTAAAYLGRFDEALDALHTAVDRAARSAVPAAPAKSRLALANVWLTLGQPAHARDVLRELPDGMVPAMQMQAALVMARAAALDGAPQQRHWQTLEQLAAAHPDLPPVQSAWYEISFQGEPQAMLSSLARVRAEFEALGLLGTARALQLRELARWLELPGDAATAEALQRAQALVPHAQTGTSGKVYPPQAWLLLAQAFERAGLPVSCSECLAQGRQWVEAALARVPSTHRAGFLAVNPVNRALLAAPAGG
jgi:tetratricopeptide (TPR) repeat protein